MSYGIMKLRSTLIQVMAWCHQAPSHYLYQWCLIINWNKLQWNLNQNTQIFIQENAFENVVCIMAAILFRAQWVKCDRLPMKLTMQLCTQLSFINVTKNVCTSMSFFSHNFIHNVSNWVSIIDQRIFTTWFQSPPKNSGTCICKFYMKLTLISADCHMWSLWGAKWCSTQLVIIFANFFCLICISKTCDTSLLMNKKILIFKLQYSYCYF